MFSVWRPLLLAASLSALSCTAVPTPENGISLPIRRASLQDTEALSARGVPVSLKNTVVTYLVDLSIGSPPQTVSLVLDTGSSETWVFSPSACGPGCAGGAYDPYSSRTVHAVNDLGPLNVGYGDHTTAQGYFVSDTVRLGAAELSGVILGVATSATKQTSTHAVMGVSFDSEENTQKQYPGILNTMLNQKLITSNSYSIWLNNITSGTGSILFGGIDSTKYTGALVPVPIVPKATPNDIPRLNVPWTSLSIVSSTGAATALTPSGFSVPVLLDTGSTSTTVPAITFAYLYKVLGVATIAQGVNLISCTPPKGYLSFGFGNAANIKVPFSELAWPIGGGKCGLGLQPQQDPSSLPIFGDTFLRSAYMNVDFSKGTIGLAQSKWQ